MIKLRGQLKSVIDTTITNEIGSEISQIFKELVGARNRIIHSFQITKETEQMLATKDKENNQFVITKDYLLEFIRKNEALSDKLHELRGY